MSSLGLTLFTALCDVGNALEAWRERYEAGSDDWLDATALLQCLDIAVDILVMSNGLDTDNEENTPPCP